MTASEVLPPASRPTRRTAKIVAIVAGVGLAALAVTGAYSTFFADPELVDRGPTAVDVGPVDGGQDVLVDGEGRTLYLFEPDEGSVVTCTGGCAAKWPPLEATPGTPTEIGGSLDETKIDAVADQDGVDVVTYDGWPLYRYVSDSVGEASGTGRDQNGGVWWALSPTGERIQP